MVKLNVLSKFMSCQPLHITLRLLKFSTLSRWCQCILWFVHLIYSPLLSFLSKDSALVEKSNGFWSDFNNVTVEWGSRHLVEAPASTRSSSEQRSCHYWFCLWAILIQWYLFPSGGISRSMIPAVSECSRKAEFP